MFLICYADCSILSLCKWKEDDQQFSIEEARSCSCSHFCSLGCCRYRAISTSLLHSMNEWVTHVVGYL
ncbi:hypothetical protein QVD17_39775 [Tagetes erecta]|uniref:Uncharacterized protein n=1 Tax=Tagetes erecta TaxID=13708 RepID=A0AAD8JR29_TARER|nr:hypothetical protein QVD17_39775 [Tagetes erecta]